MANGAEIGNAYLKILPKLSNSFGSDTKSQVETKTRGIFSGSGSNAGAEFSNAFSAKAVMIGNILADAIEAGASLAIDGAKAIIGGAFNEFADYQQFTGGIAKLYGNMGLSVEDYAAVVGQSVDEINASWERNERAQQMIMENAAQAYATAGMSANEYMENATGFSAALINSLGGDTEAAAEMTDTAMRLMSDNMNTFGTDLDRLQFALMGFSRGSFVMLDNFSLGYSGSRSGMEQLIADANEYAESIGLASDLSIDSFADMITALDLIQQKQQIQGTTAREAATTISGSLGMLSASWQNLLTGLGNPEADIGKLLENMFESLGYVVSNSIPTLEQIFSGLAEALPAAFDGARDMLGDIIGQLVGDFAAAFGDTEFGRAVLGAFEHIQQAFEELGKVFQDHQQFFEDANDVFGEIADTVGGVLYDAFIVAVDALAPFVDAMLTLGEQALPLVSGAFEFVIGVFEDAAEATSGVRDNFGETFDAIRRESPEIRNAISRVGREFEDLPDVIGAAGGAIESVSDALQPIIDAIVDALPNAIEAFGSAVEFVAQTLETLFDVVGDVFDAISPLIDLFTPDLAETLNEIGGAFRVIGEAVELIGNVFSLQLEPIEYCIDVWAELFGVMDDGNESAATLGDALNGIADVLEDVNQRFERGAKAIESVMEWLKDAILRIIDEFVPDFKQGFEDAKQGAIDALTEILPGIDSIPDDIVEKFDGMPGKIAAKFAGTAAQVAAKFLGIETEAANTAARIPGKFTGVGKSIAAAIGTIKLDIVYGTSKVGNSSITLPTKIQSSAYAEGGFIPDRRFLEVGEAGFEAILPLSGQHMLPFADAVAERLNGLASDNATNVYIDGARVNDDERISALFMQLMNELNRKQRMYA